MEDLVDLNWLESELNKTTDYDISKLLSVEITPAVSNGENYASNLLRLKLKAQSCSGNEKDVSLILKRKLDLSKFDNAAKDALNRAYFKEYNFYINIFPKLETFLQKGKIEVMKLWPECLASIECKDLYFEDLKESGYRISNRLEGLDNEHCMLVFKSFGQFHAATYIALSQHLIDIELFKEYPMLVGTTGDKKRKSTAYDFVAEIILSDWGSEWKQIADKINAIKDTLKDKVIEDGQVDLSRINVINHGDPWVNNIMFKYDSKGKPLSLKFIDFQMPHYNSFAYDISYFLNTSVGGELKKKYLNTWISAYCSSFQQILKEQNCQLSSPTEEMVKMELKRIANFSLSISMRTRPVIMCRPEDSLPLSELIKDDGLTDNKRRIYSNPALANVLKIDLPALFDLMDS